MIRNLPLMETKAEHFLKVHRDGTVSTNAYPQCSGEPGAGLTFDNQDSLQSGDPNRSGSCRPPFRLSG